MRDIQNEPAHIKLHLDRVGVSDVVYPIKVMDRKNGKQSTIGKINLYCNLPHNFRGTHMSRFIEIINRHLDNITQDNLKHILTETKQKLHAKKAHLDISFPYFLKKSAPVSHDKSYLNYSARFVAEINEDFDMITEVRIPVQTLCPCSKEISDRGAHNQRAEILISVRMSKLVWIEDLIEIGENSASSPLYTLLKRKDEKYVTEHAYDKPRFVEDVAREVAFALEHNDRIEWYFVQVTSFESIHNHNAFACIRRDKRGLDRPRL